MFYPGYCTLCLENVMSWILLQVATVNLCPRNSSRLQTCYFPSWKQDLFGQPVNISSAEPANHLLMSAAQPSRQIEVYQEIVMLVLT